MTTAPIQRALARGVVFTLFAVFLGALNAQPTPLILVGTGAPLPTLCTQQAVGNIYVRSQPPNNGPINVQRCTQTGLIAYAWMPIDHFVGPTLPTKCAVGDVAFDSDATAGQNLYGCTSADTWTAQAGSGGSTFDALTSGTNTTATLTVGTGATLTLSGTGIVNANRINNTSMAALATGPLKNTTTTGVPSIALAADIYGLWSGTCNSTTFLRGDGACNAPAGSGTVTVVSAGSLTDTALVTGGGSSTLQTAAVTATMDSSGNISTPGAISTGVGGSTAGFVALGQGTAAAAGTTNVTLYAPASVTSYTWRVPGAAATGFYLGTNTAGDVVTTQVSASGTGSVCLTVSCSMTTPAIGAATGASLVVTGALTAGSGGSTAGNLELGQGTGPTAGTTSVKIYAPSSVTSYIWRIPGAAATGFYLGTNTSGDVVTTQVGSSGSGNVVLVTGATLVTPAIGAATGTSLVLSGSLTSNALTSGRVPVAGASGILADDSDFTFSGSTATATNMAVTTGLTVAGAAITNNVVQNSQSAAYTTVLSDAGKHLYHPGADTTARTFTIDSNANVAYPIGTTLTFVNDTSGGVITIAITSDTLVLAGAGTTGSRTLAANGIATAIKVTATRWIINGTGLT